MIRSLVLVQNDVEEEGAEKGALMLRRNLARENLESCLQGDACTVWIDIVAAEEEEIHWLESQLQLTPNVVQDLLHEDRRPALMVYPKYLFLSLFQPQLQGTTVVGKEIHCLIGERFFVTVRRADATALDEAYNRVAQNPEAWKRGVAYFLYLTSQHVIDTYYPLLDRISNQLNGLEESLMDGKSDKSAQKSLYRLKQQLIGLRQMIAPQREVLSNLIGETRVSGADDIRDLFRHLYERLLRIYDVIDSQRDLTSNVMDVIDNQHARKMGEAVSRLTIFSMIFLPLTFFTGFFQLNFATIPNPVQLPISGTAMFVSLTVIMIVSMVSMVIIFRRRGWF